MVNATFEVADGIARIEIQRPEKLNAMDMETKLAITDHIRSYRTDDDVRVVILQSSGDAFCAGGDIAEVAERDFALQPFTDTWEDLFEAIRVGKPTIARVDGYALGGGFDLVVHTDIAIAADDALLGQPEVGLGIVNHFSPPILQATVGHAKARDLMLTGEPITGRDAAQAGLIARSVPADELDDEVNSVAEVLAAKSPRVLAKLKAGLYATAEMSPRAGRSYLEAISLAAAAEDPDYEEGVRAQLEGRDPEW